MNNHIPKLSKALCSNTLNSIHELIETLQHISKMQGENVVKTIQPIQRYFADTCQTITQESSSNITWTYFFSLIPMQINKQTETEYTEIKPYNNADTINANNSCSSQLESGQQCSLIVLALTSKHNLYQDKTWCQWQ